jgi:hypothetical protein
MQKLATLIKLEKQSGNRQTDEVLPMAQVKIDDIVYHLDSEFKRALADTMNKYAPDLQYDRNELFRYFQRRVYQHCSSWENVPNNLVKL